MNSWIWILLLWCCCGSRNNVADTAHEAGGAEEENTVEAVENTEVPGEETEPVEVKKMLSPLELEL